MESQTSIDRRHLPRAAFGLALALALCMARSALGRQEGTANWRIVSFPELGLTLELPVIDQLEVKSSDLSANSPGAWRGRILDSEIVLSLMVLPAAEYHLREPEDVTALMERNFGRTAPKGATFQTRLCALKHGRFGWVSYASLLEGVWKDADGSRDVAVELVLGGILADAGYVVAVRCTPPQDEVGTALLRAFLERGITYAGAMRTAEWTDEEARERWLRDAPPATHEKYERPIRTEHYLILTNSSGGKAFAKKMEECHETIQTIFPFDEVPGRKLMPVFLFRTPDEYYEYYAKIASRPLEDARKSKGHAWRDYYATWYEAPNDPVHVHEATHQIFANRLHLNGGGSWFQEGVAEYVETRDNDRNIAARDVKKGQHTPLRELMEIESLLHSAKDDLRGGSEASDNYKLAALLIEFLRESKFGRDRFQDFVHAVGAVSRNDLAAIERALQVIYGVSIAELEAQWVEYCKKR